MFAPYNALCLVGLCALTPLFATAESSEPESAHVQTYALEGKTVEEALEALRLWVEPIDGDPSAVDVYYLSNISGEEWDRLFCQKRLELEKQTGVAIKEVASINPVSLSFEYE